MLAVDLIKPERGLVFERNFCIVINKVSSLLSADNFHSSSAQFTSFLQGRQAASLLELFFSGFSLCLLTPCVCKPRSSFGEHFLLILIHIHRVWTSWLVLRVRVDFSWTELAGIICLVGGLTFTSHGLVQELLIPFKALRRRATDNGRNRSPLSRHDLGQVQKFLVFFPRPFRLLDTGIKPLVPTSFALLRRLPGQQTGNTRPLVLTILHHSCLQNLIFGVFPNTSFNHNPHLGLVFQERRQRPVV
mmetsp:Transcript_3802/g.9402  ORF Transcript_3802/g.9402 Transcript_3802/m.9402 type:complete len:246 (-) Transcript_3802:78-815(-)